MCNMVRIRSAIQIANRNFVAGMHWTELPNKSSDQIGKSCPKNVQKLCSKGVVGHFSVIFFSHFFRHFVVVLFFWAVQRFARCNRNSLAIWRLPRCVSVAILKRQIKSCKILRRAKWGRCYMGAFPNLSRNVPFCPRLSSFVLFCPRSGTQEGQKRTNGDKMVDFGPNWETPPFSIYPHLALLKNLKVWLGLLWTTVFLWEILLVSGSDVWNHKRFAIWST